MAAKTTIGQLPAAAALTGTEKLPLEQNGQTVQTTTGSLAAIIGGLNPQAVLTPAAVAGLQSDYNPPGLATASILRVSSNNTPFSIDGIVAPAAAKFLLLLNANTAEGSDMTVIDASGSFSAAQNQFLIQHAPAGGLAIGFQGGLWFWYDTASAKWRVIA